MALLMSLGMSAQQSKYSHTIQAEKLDRGVIAVKADNGVFVSWRSLLGDSKDLLFDVYRDGSKINETPLKVTNFTDPAGTPGAKYQVKAILNGTDIETSKEVAAWAENFLRVHLNRPEGGTSPEGGYREMRNYTYTPDDVSVGDVDGDGEWELIVKWFPTNQADNGDQYRYTGNTILDCYKLDGTQLWRIDLGQNIRSGNHYTQFMVYDFNGDGKAELICKTAPGTIDGQGKAVLLGDAKVTDDHRTKSNGKKDKNDHAGIVVAGPEYLTVFNGETGAEIHTIEYNPPRTIRTNSQWGDSNGNRCERYLAGVAYLDGKTPSAIFCRGYYTAAYVWAVNFDGQKLTEKWLHKSETSGQGLYGEGAHSLTIGDCDGDGFDEIVYGSAILDHDGVKVLRTGAGHGDALHLADMDPDREGLEIFMVHEEKKSPYKWDATFRDARTGEILWGNPQSAHDIGRGLAANISSKFRGYEVWPNAWYANSSDTSRANKTFTCTGEIAIDGKVPSSNFRIYWDGDLLDELFDGKYNSSAGKSYPIIEKRSENLNGTAASWVFSSYSNAGSTNGTKATPNLQADLFGDWREEIILHDQETESDLLIFSTTIPTDYRVNTLMQDRQYRVSIAWQNCGYNQPPHLSYNLEEAFNTVGAITVNGGALNQVIYLGDEIQTIGFTVIRATGVKIEGLPEGMTYSFDPATLSGSISGAPKAEGEYAFTITTTGAEEDQNATISGTIKVRLNTSIELVAHYPFEKVGETTPNSILGEIATANGGNGEAVEGKRGNALSLNGSNRYVQESYDLIDFGSNSFTIELWMNSTAVDKNCYLLNKGVISPNNGSGNWYGIEYKDNKGTKELRFAIDDNVTKKQIEVSGADKYFDGEWHHIVATRDVVNKLLNLYVDGELVASGDDPTGEIISDDEPLIIGDVTAFDNSYNGKLDELSIYRGVMSASKVKEHYESQDGHYILYFPMDEIGETTPNLAHGEATATAGIASVQGVKAGAVEFDNAEYFTQTIYDAINVGEGDFTAELWVKSTDDDGYLFCFGTHNTTNVEGGTGNWIGLERKNGYLCFAIDDDVNKSDCKIEDANYVFDGNWHHIACVRNFAGKTTTLYIDGKEAATLTGVKTGGINFSASELIFIGGDDESGHRTFGGAIDEFIVYPKALSAEEVEEHFNLLRLSEIEDIIANGGNARYTVVNAFSGMILRTAVGSDREDIIDTLEAGVYVLVVEDGKSMRTFKFVKR